HPGENCRVQGAGRTRLSVQKPAGRPKNWPPNLGGKRTGQLNFPCKNPYRADGPVEMVNFLPRRQLTPLGMRSLQWRHNFSRHSSLTVTLTILTGVAPAVRLQIPSDEPGWPPTPRASSNHISAAAFRWTTRPNCSASLGGPSTTGFVTTA